MSDKKTNNISTLSKMSVSPEAEASLQKDLQQILGYIEKLDELDVEGVDPFYHPHDLTLRLRADKAADVSGPEALQGSEGYENRLVRVPRVIE